MLPRRFTTGSRFSIDVAQRRSRLLGPRPGSLLCEIFRGEPGTINDAASRACFAGFGASRRAERGSRTDRRTRRLPGQYISAMPHLMGSAHAAKTLSRPAALFEPFDRAPTAGRRILLSHGCGSPRLHRHFRVTASSPRLSLATRRGT
jgi:hypothetical protein